MVTGHSTRAGRFRSVGRGASRRQSALVAVARFFELEPSGPGGFDPGCGTTSTSTTTWIHLTRKVPTYLIEKQPASWPKEYAREMAAESVKAGHLDLSHRVEVTDAGGSFVFTVRFGEVVAILGGAAG